MGGKSGNDTVPEQMTGDLVVARRFFNGLPGLVKKEEKKIEKEGTQRVTRPMVMMATMAAARMIELR